ncbi:MAG: nucleotidyltransferase family protein [Aristaeellaceae bacterium]
MVEERETQALLSLLAYELFGGTLPAVAADIDWDKLLQKANDHAVTALLYAGVKRLDGVPEQIVSRVRGAAIASAMHAEHMLEAQGEIIDALAAQQIPCAVLKGASVTWCYPHPELRLPGDIDLLVGEDNLEAGCHALEKLGFIVDHETDMHADLQRADVLLELHRTTSMFPQTEKGAWTADYMEQALAHVREQTLSGYTFPMLSQSYQLISLLAHMARHMSSSGIGLRQLCDWAVTVHQLRGDIGQEDIALLDQCGLLRYASMVTRMGEKYLGLPACSWVGAVPDKLVDAAMADILAVGNFHAQQGERTLSVTMMGNRMDPQSDIHSPVVNYIRYVRWKTEKTYPWAKSPLWVPVFCVFYPAQWLIRVLCGKRKGANPLKSMKTAKAREKLLRDMELYR